MINEILKWFLSRFNSKPQEQKLLPESSLISFNLTPDQAQDVRMIFECAVRSENSQTGAQECLGCGVPTSEGMQHERGCMVGFALERLPSSEEKESLTCPECGHEF